MRYSVQSKGKIFTDAARAAAVAARQAKALLPKGDGFAAFAVRMTDDGKTYGWEIRRFGAIIVWRSHLIFSSSAAASAAGIEALAEYRLKL